MKNSSDAQAHPSYKRGYKIGTIVGVIIIPLAVLVQLLFIPPDRSARYDSRSKIDLHNIFLACNSYWADNGPENNCTPTIAAQEEYGYIQSVDVTISTSGTGTDFLATAQNMSSANTFSIDSNGTITEEVD